MSDDKESGSILSLPRSITGNVEQSDVRDLTPLLEKKEFYKILKKVFILMFIFVLIGLFSPISMVGFNAKYILPYLGLLFIIGFLASRAMDIKIQAGPIKNKIAQPKIRKKPLGDNEISIGFDIDSGEEHILTAQEITEHLSFIGGSGSGKTTSNNAIIMQALERNWPIIYMNGKRSEKNVRNAAYMAEITGRRDSFRVIDPLSKHGHHMNPLMTTREVGKIANKIIGLLPSSAKEGGATHYRDVTYGVIVDLVKVLVATNKSFTYRDILGFITQPQSATEILLEELESKGEKEALFRLRSMFMGTGKKTSDSIFKKMRDDMSGLEAQLQALVTLEAGKFICSDEPSVSILESIKKNHFLYIALPVLQDREQSERLAGVLNLELIEAIGEIYNSGQALDRPCLVVLEELSSYATVDLQVMFEQGREANFAFLPFLQTSDTLENRDRGLSEQFMESIMGNCNRKYWMRINGNKSRQWASDSFGDVLRHMATVSKGEMSGESGKRLSIDRFINPNVDVRGTMTVGYSEQLDKLVHPRMFGDLGKWEALTYADGGVKHIKLNHSFIDVPPDYDYESKIPKLPFHGKQKPLNLHGRVHETIKEQIYSQVQEEDYEKLKKAPIPSGVDKGSVDVLDSEIDV